MEQPNRRKFLIAAGAGAGAAAVGVAAAKAGLTGPDAPSGTAATLPAGAGPLVAYVEDARSGRVSVLTGEAETVVHDPDLVARLSRAAKGRTA